MIVARAYRAKLLTPRSDREGIEWLRDALVVVEGARVTRVEAWSPRAFVGPVKDLHPCVLVPGFVDAHVHFPQTRVVGSASGPLLDWLERTVFPEEARFRSTEYAREVASEMTHRMLSAGTTLAAIFSSSSPSATDALFEALEASGMRALAGLTLMDSRCPKELAVERREAIAACEALVERWHDKDDGRLRFAVTPRFALSCSKELLDAAGIFAREKGLYVQTHISENGAELQATREAFPEALDYLDVYDRAGLVGDRTILAHAIHLSAREWDRVASAGAKIAHCPDSNFFLGSGNMKLSEATSRGICVALGTDVAAGRSFDVRRQMSYAFDNALTLAARVSAEELFRMATLGGAEALGVSSATGSIEPGKEADFVALDLPEYIDGKERALAEVAFGDGARVERTFVRGRELFSRRA